MASEFQAFLGRCLRHWITGASVSCRTASGQQVAAQHRCNFYFNHGGSSVLLSRQEKPEVWLVLTMPVALKLLATLEVITLSIRLSEEETGLRAKVISPRSFSDSWLLNCPFLGATTPR